MANRLLVISDPHGRYDELIALLRYVKFRTGDTLLILGDLVDRGPKSAQIVQWVMNVQGKADVRVVIGNHEHMLLAYAAGHLPEKEYFTPFIGGEATLKSYRDNPDYNFKEHLQFISCLPKTIEIGKYIFTHGGLNPSAPMKFQTLQDTVWDCNDFAHTPGIPGKTVVFGHHHTYYLYESTNKLMGENSRIWYDPVYRNKIGVDCGYIKNKKLACLDLTNNIEYYCKVYSFQMEEIPGPPKGVKINA